jgi:hypothetical protein
MENGYGSLREDGKTIDTDKKKIRNRIPHLLVVV